MTAPPRQNFLTELSNTQYLARLYFQPCRIPTRHGKHTIFSRETVPARKREITLPDIENMPVLLWNQSIQENEKNMDTGTLISGSTTPNRHSMLSTLTHTRRVPQNFQQLQMESSNMVVLPCFTHNAEATTHMETSKNVHDKETLSTNHKMDTNMNANIDTNHMAH